MFSKLECSEENTNTKKTKLYQNLLTSALIIHMNVFFLISLDVNSVSTPSSGGFCCN